MLFPSICEAFADWLWCEENPDECTATFEQMQTAAIEFCKENPDACAAMFERMQTQAIEYCEEYPDECQQAFDTWAESFQEEDTE